MEVKILILLAMVFCHIVDDYYLQGWLASAKQKIWWEKNAPNKMYQNDYLVALFFHGFSWSFMIMSPLLFYNVSFGWTYYTLLFAANIVVHCYVDNLKANKKRINLIQDQIIHMIQIFVTWLCWLYIC